LVYRDLTFLTEGEIRHAFTRFCALSQDFVTKRLIQQHKEIARLDLDWIAQMEELRNNPFRDRIIKCFSIAEDGSMSFPEFLEMVSVFSEDAPFELKCDYAFRIYDTTDSDVLNRDDIKNCIYMQIGKNNPVPPSDVERLVDIIMQESDLDSDGKICDREFQRVMEKSQSNTDNPPFTTTFCVPLR